jgi:low temperature requirement protein LtrA
MIGFAWWWTYFDFVGRRLPRDQGRILARWMYSHLPVTLSIAAAGAAMVSLIAHAGDPRAPTASAWLLSGSVALGLVALNATMSALQDYDRLPTLYRPLSIAMLVAAGVAVLVGWWRPTPWIMTLALVMTLAAVWTYAIHRWLQLHNRDESDGTLSTGT